MTFGSLVHTLFADVSGKGGSAVQVNANHPCRAAMWHNGNKAWMTGNRSKDAWIWVAIAAISLASLARAQSGIENARAYADPVIKFFAAGQHADTDASAHANRATSRSQDGASGIGFNLLPVFFVGLVSPLVLESFRAYFRRQRVPSRAVSCRSLPASASRPLRVERPPQARMWDRFAVSLRNTPALTPLQQTKFTLVNGESCVFR